MKTPSIPSLSSDIRDNGRRGNPKPGCDCVQCFGYCLVDQDAAHRERLERKAHAPAFAVPEFTSDGE
jgi:hypothetical protein